MARLERLVIQGFKSFKRKTSIPLPEGFSTITGPNGSGKSNIGDAISFVIGKSSTKALRAKKGQNLIFHGGKTKAASDFANVILYFNNKKKTLPVKEKDVSVGRRINRKGVSTYRLNGKVVTRQQVVDILSQASIHPDGHNIIQQGDVNRIVEMDPVQRRGIIDEVSGIRDYDEKKIKASKELDRVAEKVREAEILLTEKGNVMEKLKSERDSALEHKRLHEELEKVKKSIILKDFSNVQSNLEKINKNVMEKEREFKDVDKQVQKYDKDMEKEEKRLQNLTKEVVKASSQIEVSKKINRLQSSIEIKKDKVDSLQRETDRIDSIMERVSKIENKVNPGVKEILGFSGVKGVLLDLIAVPNEYRTAIEVAAGGHLNDIIVDSSHTAVKCINHLKSKRLGRARFLPLDKIMPGRKGSLPPACVGWLSDLIHFDKKYFNAMEYVFGRTACVKDIDTARKIMNRQRMRMVTLDGDLVEMSGAMTGGHRRKSGGTNINSYLKDKQSIIKQIENLEDEISVLSKELSLLAEKERKTKTFDIEGDRQDLDKRLDKLRTDRKVAYEKRMILQQELGRMNIQKAKYEANFDSIKLQVPKKKDIPYDKSVAELRAMERGALEGLNNIGPVNMKAIDDFDSVLSEFEEFKEKVDEIAEEKASIQRTIEEIEEKRRNTFMTTMNSIAKHFKNIYSELTKGEAELILEDPENIDTGLLIKATPPGKKLLQIDSMSGGEKTLTAFAFVFSLQRFNPAPFYILDEADAALDKLNTKKVSNLLRKQSKDTQFIVISHNDNLVKEADQIFGVTMSGGESKVMGIEVPKK